MNHFSAFRFWFFPHLQAGCCDKCKDFFFGACAGIKTGYLAPASKKDFTDLAAKIHWQSAKQIDYLNVIKHCKEKQ
jgi:hypothetical protein